VVASSGPGYVTVYPCGASQTLASSVNLVAGDVVPNAVLARMGDGGRVCLFTSSDTHLVIDVNAWFRTDSSASYTVPSSTAVVTAADVVATGQTSGGEP
jgi:hypothetical protein